MDRSGADKRIATIDDELVDRIQQRIRSNVEPEAILLIGSAARGDTHAESDIDLVVVMDVSEDETSIDKARDIHRLFSGWRVPMDVIVLTPEEFDEGQDLPGHIARVASNSGKTLYERSA